MRKPAKILLFALIVALLPLRGIAAMASDSCASAQEQPAATSPADTHCPGPVVALTAASPVPLPARATGRAIVFAEPATLTFVPDPLDPPPLALFR